MQLDDLIEEQSIESIAKKTNLAEAVVAKLFNRDFKTLSLPQALGALSIIEREYDVDLGALRQECKAYFADQKTSESTLPGPTPIKNKKRVIPRLLVFVLLAVLAYGAWYFFTEYYKQKILPMDPKSEKSLIDTILHGSGTVSKDVKSNTTIESLPESDVPKNIAGDVAVVGNEDNSVLKQERESNESSPAVVSEIVIEEEVAETSQSTLPTVSETIVEEQNNTAATVEADETPEVNDTIEQAPVVLARETMTLLPQEVMWFRLIDLNTKKRREFRRKDRYEIDLRKHDWLFATENAHFAIIDDDRFEEFSGDGKLFFQLDQEGIHQLNEDEFRAAEK